MLDLFQEDQKQQEAWIVANSGRDLPATFGDTFGAAWSEGLMFGGSLARQQARVGALSDFLDDVHRRTGERIQVAPTDDGSGMGTMQFDGWSQANAELEKLRAKDPNFPIAPVPDDEIEQRTIAKGKRVHADFETMAAREKTFGGGLGMAAGGMAAAALDPVNIIALPIAPAAEAGILGNALRWGLIAGASQTAIEAASAQFHEQVQPGYSESGAPALSIVEAMGGGAALGGGIKGLGNLWTRLKTGAWPRSVRDAGNVIESEANIANTNVLPGVEGEVANREALSKAIDDIVAGRPVDVDTQMRTHDLFAPEADLMATRGEAVKATEAAKEASATARASGELPFEPTAQEAVAERHVGTLADGIQDIARLSGHEMERADAEALAARVAKAPDDEAQQIIAEAVLRPRTVADTLPSASAAAKERGGAAPEVMSPELAAQHTPEALEKMRTDPELDETLLRDLDRLRAEKGDFDVPMGEQVDAQGNRVPISRKIDSVLAEADAREAAAREIELCAGPQPHTHEAQ